MTVWVGIDPGQTGGVAVISSDGRLLDVVPMPTIDKDVAGNLLAGVLRGWSPKGGSFKVCIEDVHSMPKQGVASTFKFGKSFGIALGVVQGAGLPLARMRPQEWKKVMGLTGKDKNASRALATELWPSMAEHWQFKSQDGKAEAALIAEAARRTL